MSEIILKVNDKNYANWTELSIRRSVDEFCGSFAFTSTDTQDQGYPVKRGDAVEVLVDGVTKVKGFIDQIRADYSIGSHTISVVGRDNVSNVIDSDVPNNWKVAENVTKIKGFETMCRFILNATGNRDIPIVNEAGTIPNFTDEEKQEAEPGQKAMDFLASFARKRNVYLNTDGNGAFRIFRPQSNPATDSISLVKTIPNQNNVLSRTFVSGEADRYRTVVVRSQENPSGGFYDFTAADATGTATDSDVRSGRILDFMAEETMTNAECKNRAKEEVNIRRARSVEYTCTVAGASQSDGTPWDYGFTIAVADETADIFGTFFIRSATITKSLDRGTITQLVLVPPDAYKVKDELTAQDRRKTNLGTKYSK